MDAIIEFYQVGDLIKVSAIDPKTKTEVSVALPKGLSREDMVQAAIRKLEYVLNKETV